jgi:rhodanese-related sulfurtransferase
MKNKIRHFSSHEAFDLLQSGEAVLLDIRDEYLQGFKCIDVPAVLQIPFGELAEKAANLPHEIFYICTDSAGINSKKAAQILIDAGFSEAGNLAGGLIDWERLGLPVCTDIKERLTGSCMCQLKRREKKP